MTALRKILIEEEPVFAAPVFGLAYVVLFPFIGLATLFWLAGRAVMARTRN